MLQPPLGYRRQNKERNCSLYIHGIVLASLVYYVDIVEFFQSRLDVKCPSAISFVDSMFMEMWN